METSKTVSHCDLNCRLSQIRDSSPFPPRIHIDDEHVARDDSYVKRVTAKLYTSLVAQQYRVLEILPGKPRSSLKCKLLRATLTPVDGARLDEGTEQGRLIEYAALSYRWGDQKRTCSVDCDGFEVPITPHLKNALCSIRSRAYSRYVWNDVLCINQLGDIEEKGEQVQLMFTIFKKARKVIGWLGSSNEACKYEGLFTSLHYDSTRGLSERSNLHDFQPMYSQVGDTTCDCELTSLKSSAIELVRQDQWFQRTWIRQEIFAAKRVEMRYGPYRFELSRLIQLIELVDSTYSRADLQLFHTMVKRHITRAQTPSKLRTDGTSKDRVEIWLEEVLSNAQGFRAEKDQDLIYALQNIAQPEARRSELLFPTIDYKIPKRELFEHFIKRLVSLDGSLAPLSIFEDRRDFQSADLPSWVPDWKKVKTRLARPDRSSYLLHGYKFDTSQPGVLSAYGAHIGTVREEWPMDEYEKALSAWLGKNNVSFVFAPYKVYRSSASSLSYYAPFNDMPVISNGLEEIAYRPYTYTTEGIALVDSQRQPYVLASVVVRPGDLLISFAWETASLTRSGYERATWCSVLRRCQDGSDRYRFLGPCVFNHFHFHQPDTTEYRAPQVIIQKYDLI